MLDDVHAVGCGESGQMGDLGFCLVQGGYELMDFNLSRVCVLAAPTGPQPDQPIYDQFTNLLKEYNTKPAE